MALWPRVNPSRSSANELFIHRNKLTPALCQANRHLDTQTIRTGRAGERKPVTVHLVKGEILRGREEYIGERKLCRRDLFLFFLVTFHVLISVQFAGFSLENGN